MKQCLDAFSPTLDSVRHVESTISALADCLESPSIEWLENVRRHANRLEVISAIAYDEERQSLTDMQAKKAVECVENLKKLVQEVYVPPAEDEIPEDWL